MSSSAAERYEPALEIEHLRPSKTNPRKHFTGLEELAASISEKGIIEPLVVRQVDAGSHKPMAFEIVAGERRYRAAKLAGHGSVPAIIRAYSDAAVLEVQLIENIQRDDLTPLEQARGYKALMASDKKHTPATIAQRLGKSETWVWDRLKLNDLIPAAASLLEQGRMSSGHAILIARQKPEDQQRIVDLETGALFETEESEQLPLAPGQKPNPLDDWKPRSIRELECWISDHIRFDVAHMAQAQPLTFAAAATTVQAAEERPGRGKKVVAITFDDRIADDAKDEDERTYGWRSWRRADGTKKTQLSDGYPRRLVDSPTCEYAVLGVVAVGSEHYGETFPVCINRDKCTVHWGKEIKARATAAKQRAGGQGKKAAKNEKRRQTSWQETQHKQELEREAWNRLKPHAIAAAAARIKLAPATDRLLQDVMSHSSADSQQLLKKLLGGPVTVKNFGRAWAIVENVIECSWSRTEFERKVAKKFKVDLKALAKLHTPAPAAKEAKAS